MGPPAAISNGAAWRVSPNNILYSPYTNYTANVIRIPVQNGDFSIELKPIPGFATPTNNSVQILCDQGSAIYPAYRVAPPLLLWLGQTNLAISGVKATRYRIEYVNDLRQFSNWVSLGALTLTNGLNSVPGATTTNIASRFYRAIWLP